MTNRHMGLIPVVWIFQPTRPESEVAYAGIIAFRHGAFDRAQLPVIHGGMDAAPESSETVSSRYAPGGHNWRLSSSQPGLHSLHKVATHNLNNGR
jgi:hypothetical protein